MRKLLKYSLLSLFILLLVSCQNTERNDTVVKESVIIDEPSKIENQVYMSDIGYNDFLEVLSLNNVSFTEEISSEESFLSVKRKPVIIDKEIISIYEYDTKDDLEKDASGISEDGSSISIENSDGILTGVEISWTSYPHFFKNNKLIINYVGEDTVILQLLNDLFDDEFAGYDYTN